MKKHLLFAAILSLNCLSAFSQTSFQTRTATYLNNLNNFQDVYVNAYPNANAQDVAVDDGIYAYSNKLTAQRSYASLALQGFGFTIPDGAIIENIAVKVRRFKKGGPAIKDYFVSVMQSYSGSPTNGVSNYGFMWRNGDVYPGNYYPDTETEYIFSQSGSGNNGGYNHNQAYQWTPAMVNVPYFGVRVDVYPPEGKGTVVVYYDLVEITVEYSQPVTIVSKSPAISESKQLKEPIVFPNPFTTKTNIQFTAIESGNAVVELYNITGAKIHTLFSGVVDEGQVYNVTVGDAQLSKGIYVYIIRNGKQKQTGRIIKLE
jgi:hypothetical protein